MGGVAPMIRRAAAGSAAGRGRGVAVGARPPARPAGDTAAARRGHAALLDCAAAAGLGERLLERLVAEHRALQAGGADSIPSRSSRSSARKAATSVTGLPLISSVRRLALAWLIAQPRPVNPTRSTTPSRTPSWSVIRSPHRGFEPSIRRGRILDDPEVVGPPIVLEDVVAVEVVHWVRVFVRAARPIPSFFVGIESRAPAVLRQSKPQAN